jgi:hypothetical protein
VRWLALARGGDDFDHLGGPVDDAQGRQFLLLEGNDRPGRDWRRGLGGLR